MKSRTAAFVLVALILLLALAILLAPVAATAQQAGKVYRIGYLSPRPGIEPHDEAFRQGLRELGWVEGRNLLVEWRFSRGRTETFPSLAAELVRLNVDCIVAIGVGAIRAAKEVTATIPIVMGTADDDPVRRGLIESFARPGGNVTGIVNLGEQVAGKRLQLLKEVVPGASRVAILWPPFEGGPSPHLRETEAAARALGIQLQSIEVRAPDELGHAFNSAVKGRAEALIVVGTGFVNRYRPRVLDLAARTRLPVIYSHVGWVYEGGLMSYASDPAAQYRRAASYMVAVGISALGAWLSIWFNRLEKRTRQLVNAGQAALAPLQRQLADAAKVPSLAILPAVEAKVPGSSFYSTVINVIQRTICAAFVLGAVYAAWPLLSSLMRGPGR
jgi:putative ABC transport system substrate-binding protein